MKIKLLAIVAIVLPLAALAEAAKLPTPGRYG